MKRNACLSLVSPGEEQSNTSKHCNCVLFRKVAARTEVLKGPTADELETGVVICPRLESFVEFDLREDNRNYQETKKDTHSQADHGKGGVRK